MGSEVTSLPWDGQGLPCGISGMLGVCGVDIDDVASFYFTDEGKIDEEFLNS